MDIDFDEVPCELISLDVSDVMGTNLEDIMNNNLKTLNLKRFVINDKRQVLNEFTLSEIPDIRKVIERVKNKEGCKVAGILEINKVPGNLHFSLEGRHRDLLVAVLASEYRIKLDHVIHRFQFGLDDEELAYLKNRFGRGRSWAPLEYTMGVQPHMVGSL